MGGPLAAASGALVVEYRPPTRPSSERVRRGSRTGPAAVPCTQKLARPAEHSRLSSPTPGHPDVPLDSRRGSHDHVGARDDALPTKPDLAGDWPAEPGA